MPNNETFMNILHVRFEEGGPWIDIPALKGEHGDDGISPGITVSDITGGHRITITDRDHPDGQNIDVMDGESGTDGEDGEDGVSPGVTITEISGGHQVKITDKDHPSGQTFNVMDGSGGASDAGHVTYDPTETYDEGTIGAAANALNAGKVDKVTGKGLSTEDYTTAEKSKLAGIAAGAEANVQSDWNETDFTSDAFIKNKPDLSLKQNKTDNSLTTTAKTITGAINEIDGDVSTHSSQISALQANVSTLQSGKTNVSDFNAFKRYNFFVNKGKVHGGYDLGSTFTAAQQAAIANGSFSEMDIGDYWSIGGKRQRIWDGDWALNKGDTRITTHHLVLMTDDDMLKGDGSTTHYMNDTDTTAGGYSGTKYRSTYRSQLKNTWAGWFGAGHILTHRELLCNAVTNGKASGCSWTDCDVELPSEVMMYGSTIWSNYTDGGSGYNVGTAYPQLALAAIDPSRVANRENYWLRDVASASNFADVLDYGHAANAGASNAWVGLRPYILLK